MVSLVGEQPQPKAAKDKEGIHGELWLAINITERSSGKRNMGKVDGRQRTVSLSITFPFLFLMLISWFLGLWPVGLLVIASQRQSAITGEQLFANKPTETKTLD